MKLLLVSDLHCDHRAARAVVERSTDVDAVLGAGDFATVHRGLGGVIEVLKAMRAPAVLVPGNNETLEELDEACRGWDAAHVLHGRSAEIGGRRFYGLGGGVPVTPFGDWSYDFTEDQARALLEGMPVGAVLVSHSPPRGLGDATSAGQHVGSEAVLEAIGDKRPPLVVCGHVHDSWGFDASEGPTRVVNVGPGGMVVHLP